MKLLHLKSYAKVNLYLHVGARRTDGYHDIETKLQAVSLHDDVSFEFAADLSIECSVPELSGEANLASKALRLLSELVELPKVRIFVEKRIPVQAGLGGGSSNVACVLRGIGQLTGNAVAESDILAIACACGSDVPFFLCDSTCAVATGRGETLVPEVAEAREVVIAKPAIGVSTAAAYAALDSLDVEQRVAKDGNDFERVAPCESVELMKRMATLGCEGIRLCGSGSAVFGFVDGQESGERVTQLLAREKYWAVPCRTLTKYE